MKWLITLDNPVIPSGVFEADSEDEARQMAQDGIDLIAQTTNDTPPEIVSVEAIDGE